MNRNDFPCRRHPDTTARAAVGTVAARAGGVDHHVDRSLVIKPSR